MKPTTLLLVVLTLGCTPPEGMDDAMPGPGDLRSSDGGAPTPSKQLHLVVASSGEDLGVLVDLQTFTVFVEKANALVTLNRAVHFGMPSVANYHYVDRDCKGTPMIYRLGNPEVPPLHNSYYWLGPAGTYVRMSKQLPRTPYQSMLIAKDGAYDGMTTCRNTDPAIRDDFWEPADSGVRFQKPTYKPEDLRVEAR